MTEEDGNNFQHVAKLEIAKRELNSLEEKFKKFKEKSREHTERKYQSKLNKDKNVPVYSVKNQNQNPIVPDLRQYFSFMMEKENQPCLENLNDNKKSKFETNYEKNELKNEENLKQKMQQKQKRSISDKLSEQKNIAITNLEQFYASKKSQLDAKTNELEEAKAKALQDINLLKRNNAELQTQIDFEKNMMYNSATESLREKNRQLLEKIQSKKQSIESVKNNVQKINSKKEQLKKNINELLKGNKKFITQDKNSHRF